MSGRSRTVPQTEREGGTCQRCGGPLTKTWDPDEGEVWTCENLSQVKPQSRAVVALSEDRQWLVVLKTTRQGAHWFEVQRSVNSEETNGYLYHQWVKDTGQSAEDVLAAFLEERS